MSKKNSMWKRVLSFALAAAMMTQNCSSLVLATEAEVIPIETQAAPETVVETAEPVAETVVYTEPAAEVDNTSEPVQETVVEAAPTEAPAVEAAPTEAAAAEAAPTEAAAVEVAPTEAPAAEAAPTEAAAVEAAPTEAPEVQATPTEEQQQAAPTEAPASEAASAEVSPEQTPASVQEPTEAADNQAAENDNSQGTEAVSTEGQVQQPTEAEPAGTADGTESDVTPDSEYTSESASSAENAAEGTEQASEAASENTAEEEQINSEKDTEELTEAADESKETEESESESETEEKDTTEYATQFDFNNGRVAAYVTLSNNQTMPKGASFVVENKAGYNIYDSACAAVSAALANLGMEIGEALVYDIYFTMDGSEIQPQGSSYIDLTFPAGLYLEGNGPVKVYHIVNGAAYDVTTGVSESGGMIWKVSFVTDSYSPFVVVRGAYPEKETEETEAVETEETEETESIEEETDETEIVFDMISPIHLLDQVTSNNLRDFLTNVSITGSGIQVDGNKYTVVDGRPYNIQLSFAEINSMSIQFSEETLTYTLPAGINANAVSSTIDIEVTKEDGSKVIVRNNPYTINGNILTFNWNKSDENWSVLRDAGNVNIRFDITATFDSSASKLEFSSSIEKTVDVQTGGRVTVNKTGEYLGDKIKYTATVSSTGNSTNVNVTDTISGTALSDAYDITISSSI